AAPPHHPRRAPNGTTDRAHPPPPPPPRPGAPRGGAAAPPGTPKHRPPKADPVLPRLPAPPQPAGPRPAHQDQRPHSQGAAQDRGGQEGRQGDAWLILLAVSRPRRGGRETASKGCPPGGFHPWPRARNASSGATSAGASPTSRRRSTTRS